MKKLSNLAVVATIMLFVVFAVASNDTSERAQDNTPNTPSNSPSNDALPDSPTSTPEAETQDDFTFEITYVNAETWKNSIGTVWVQVIFEVTNTGSKPLYLSSGACDLEDESGALVKSISLMSVYPDVIDPGEKAYYYEETTLDIDNPIDITVLPRPDVKGAKIDNIRFPVTEITFSDATFGDIKMLGRIENTSDEEQTWVTVAAILFSENGNPIGVVRTHIIENIAPGAKIGFETSSFSMPDNINADMIADYIVYAFPLQFQF